MQLKTLFVITILTSRMIMPGLPDMPAGFSIPGMGSAARSLRMDLTSDKKATAQSRAECAVPQGLKVGPKVDLEIDLPAPSAAPEGSPGDGGKAEKSKFTIKMYWDCSDTVPAGQPKVMDSDTMMKGLPADSRKYEQMMRSGRKMPARSADESHAYWPGHKPEQIKDDAASPGFYKLTTNYCGGTSITFDPAQDFLAPFEVISPGKSGVDLDKAIKVEWKSIPNAEAYVLTAFAGRDNETVQWTSSAQPEVMVDYMSKPLSKAEIKDYIEKGILLPPTKTLCNIPAGIFKDVSTPMLTLMAIGVDKTQEKDGIRTSVTVRSTATVMLGGEMGSE